MEQTATYEETEALDLRYYVNLALRNILVLVLLPVALAAGAYFNADRETPMYTATAEVLLRPDDPNEQLNSAGSGNQTLYIGEEYVRSQARLAESPAVQQKVAEALGTEPAEIGGAVSVDAVIDSNILEMAATTDDPERSKQIADEVANQYILNRRDNARQGLTVAIEQVQAKLDTISDRIDELTGGTPTAQDATALEAAQNEYASLTSQLNNLEINLNLKRGEAELIAEADVPGAPVSPRPKRSAILGGMLGLLLAAGIVLLRDRFDTRLRGTEEAEAVTGLPSVGEIPFDRTTDRQPTGVAVVREPDGALAEAVRSLRVSLRFLALEDPLKVVLITSATPADGKSTLAANLAASYAGAGQRTLLVSGDLRRPKAEKLVGSLPGPGLVDLLSEIAGRHERQLGPSRNGAGHAAPALGSPAGAPAAAPPPRSGGEAAMLTSERVRASVPQSPLWITEWCHADEDNMWVLPAGQPVANPVEILGSIATREFFELARAQFDVVIIDSPPLGAVADAAVLAPYCDGVLMVCGYRRTSRNQLQRATQTLTATHARILGLVVNFMPTKRRYGGYYNYGYGVSPNPKID